MKNLHLQKGHHLRVTSGVALGIAMYEYIKEVLRFELVLIVIPVEAILILDDSIQEMDVQQCLKKLL